MNVLAHRVVARYLAAVEAEKGKGKVPVRNKDTGRLVYVLPETMQEESSRFERATREDLQPEGYKHRPTPPKQPPKPDKPHVPRDPIPVPPKYPKPPQPVKLPKPPKLRGPVKPVPVPEPPKPRKYPKFPGRKQYKTES